jgi:hypothetical protein
VTPVDAPTANSPQAGSTVTAQNANFDVQSVTGANQYMIEFSKDPSFKSGVQQVILPIQAVSQQSGSVTQTIDLTKLFSNYHGTLYWHAGARNSIDQPGPDPGIYSNGGGDRRWVYSGLESFNLP